MTHALHRPLVPLALSMAMALTLSACSQDAPAEFEDTATQQQAAAEDTATDPTEEAGESPDTTEEAGESPDQGDEAQEADDVTSQSAAAAGVDLTDQNDPVGTATIPAIVDGDPDASMDVTLYELRRDGDTVVATYSFLVHSEEETPKWLYHYLGNQLWSPFLVDTVNLNRHDVLGPARESRVMTESTGFKFRPGQTFYAMAVFAAPPQDVTTLTAHLVDGAPAVTEVPIR